MAPLNRHMDLIQHVLEILVLQVPQRLHRGPLHLLYVAHRRRDLIMHRDDPGHHLIEPLVLVPNHFVEKIVEILHTVVDDLDAVVQVCELVLLGLNVGSKDILEHLRDVGIGRALGPEAAVDAGRWLDFLLRLCVLALLLFLGFFASMGIRGGDDEFVDFEAIRIFSTRCAYTEVVAFWQLDLGLVLV